MEIRPKVGIFIDKFNVGVDDRADAAPYRRYGLPVNNRVHHDVHSNLVLKEHASTDCE